jgi:low affinity Fe/Cu permease
MVGITDDGVYNLFNFTVGTYFNKIYTTVWRRYLILLVLELMQRVLHIVESITRGVGSLASVIIHTIAFLSCFILGCIHTVSWDLLLLILTTVVSLEAIYLAIFIQMTVNQNTASLREVEKDIDAIEKDVDEIQGDDAEEERRDQLRHQALLEISARLQKVVQDLEKNNKTR